jgi:hypothetical protein
VAQDTERMARLQPGQPAAADDGHAAGPGPVGTDTDAGPGTDADAAPAPGAGELGELGDHGAPGDQLPAELDVTGFVGPYQFPNISRRRIAGTLYLVLAVACAAGWLVTDNRGLLGAAVALGVIAAIHFVCAWNVAVDETEALVIATREVGFPVGHASAAMAWRGWRSRPEWRILVYSAEDPPAQRGIVQVNAVTGAVDGSFTQPNREDWTQLR